MTHTSVQVRELAAWGLDEYKYRPDQHAQAANLVASRPAHQPTNPILPEETAQLHEAFDLQALRPDLLAEMTGLTWSLAVVDLRLLIAFQRRLSFPSHLPARRAPELHDWSALFALCFGPAKPIQYESMNNTNTLLFESDDPNLSFRTTSDPAAPITLHAGSPFFEVACFRNRWFLRDGYHRAYAFLRAGIHAVPAVVAQATTLSELGADRPWFFPEEILFSPAPPLVTDFLIDAINLNYQRPPLIKTLRITMEETLAPAPTGATP